MALGRRPGLPDAILERFKPQRAVPLSFGAVAFQRPPLSPGEKVIHSPNSFILIVLVAARAVRSSSGWRSSRLQPRRPFLSSTVITHEACDRQLVHQLPKPGALLNGRRP